MKLDNKGFAISSIMYIILILAIILISLTLAIFSGRKIILDNQKNDALHEIYGTKFKNGDIVYFDVEKGIGCTKEEYESSYDEVTLDYLNSKIGYNGFNNKTSESDITPTDKLEGQNSCLKFYVYNDNGGDSINLLLDHNTTALVAWNSSASNVTGPKTIIKQLKIDTSEWKGTMPISNYIVSQGENYANYAVDYSEYKARLITAEEIAQITSNTTFDELVSTSSSNYYFDSKTSTLSETCKEGNTSGCQYRWLYDRTSINCKIYGCLNNSKIETYGYWTGTSTTNSTGTAWYVHYSGYLNCRDVGNSVSYGVRPVITVLRENIL